MLNELRRTVLRRIVFREEGGAVTVLDSLVDSLVDSLLDSLVDVFVDEGAEVGDVFC